MNIEEFAAHINAVREGKRGTYSTFQGCPIAKAEVTKINGRDIALWITLTNGRRCVAYTWEITL